jgi:hypothetical protein
MKSGVRPIGLMILLAGCAAGSVIDRPFGPDGKTIRQEIQTYPEEQRAAFALAERRCTACHTLNEPFSAHVAAGGWLAIVRKMARQPGAFIPSADQEKIAGFFEYFFQRRAAKDK